ncbi:MAG TPA: YegS/Rv2252/BmrU family lipid kinase [Acholeplasmataceae bacterium]|nr:YegS/Rv2252/BmrU family lipid kinase [Acholeplasmataceae bacterium]
MTCIFIYNPESGNGRIKRRLPYIIQTLKRKYSTVDVHQTKSKEDCINAAVNACNKYDAIIFAGGDGTFNDITCGVASQEKRPILGYIPTGTVNDIAKNLKIPRNIKKALKVILKGGYIKHDVGMINDTYFMYVAAVGTFSSVSYRTKRRTKKVLGRLAYAFDGMNDLINPQITNVIVKCNDCEYKSEAPLLMILNSKSIGGVVFNKNGHLNDGKFDLMIVKNSRHNGLINIFKMMLSGIFRKNIDQKAVKHIKTSKIHVQLQNDATWCVDGEAGPKGNVYIENLHQHLEIYAPIKNNHPKSKYFG